MSASSQRRQRLLIRATLVAGVLLAGLGLVAVWQARGRAPAAALARGEGRGSDTPGTLRVRVVDGQDRVVPGARVFVRSGGGAPPLQARWSPEHGTLMLPRGERPYDLRVLARGFRVTDVPDVHEDLRVVLERGPTLQVRVHDAPSDGLPENVFIMLRVLPLETQGTEELDVKAVVDLMDNLGGPGPRDAPRGDFGYPVSLPQARRGVRLPATGRYRVIWGLIDMPSATWFTLGAASTRDVQVDDGPHAARVDVVLTPAALQSTLDGLRAMIARASDR